MLLTYDIGPDLRVFISLAPGMLIGFLIATRLEHHVARGQELSFLVFCTTVATMAVVGLSFLIV